MPGVIAGAAPTMVCGSMPSGTSARLSVYSSCGISGAGTLLGTFHWKIRFCGVTCATVSPPLRGLVSRSIGGSSAMIAIGELHTSCETGVSVRASTTCPHTK